ncbi:MAG: prolyl oligopeptidase family serine peptidase [Gammaproteobacteria bacterium]
MIGKTRRFAAAGIIYPITDWSSMALTVDRPDYYPFYWMGGLPWEPDMHAHYWARSPLSIVGDVETPALLVCGEKDWRTPIAQSEMYFSALKLRGVDVLVPEPAGGIARVVAGLGNARELDPLDVAQLSASLPPGDYTFDALPAVLDVGLVRFAWLLGTYRFDRYRSGRAPLNPPRLVFDGPESGVLHAAQAAEIAFAGTRLALDLINTPAADCGPREIEAIVHGMAAASGARTRVTHEPAELATSFPLVHAVGRASERAPRVIELFWGDEAAPRLTLVGKGVCFDTGGLALKPLDRMRHMKKDMAGAAHVLALAHMIISTQLPVRLRSALAFPWNRRSRQSSSGHRRR